VGERMGVTPQGPVEANRGVRARICAAGKALEGHDRQTHKQIYGNYRIDNYCIVLYCSQELLHSE